MICNLYPWMFADMERDFLRSSSFALSLFRYGSGVEAVRIRAGRGEFVWLPFLGQQIWEWKIDGKSAKFSGFVAEPSYGRNFLQNYGGFLLHCGMTAMGNPGPGDSHLHHGELPVARFDSAWISLSQDSDGKEALTLSGRLHWHVPFVAEYRLSPSLRLRPDGLSVQAELGLDNPSAAPLDYMYLAHINFPISGAKRILTTLPFDPGRASLREELFPGQGERPEAVRSIDQKAAYDPELVVIVRAGGLEEGSVGSVLQREDGTAFWVSQETSILDHYVVWITRAADRGACGFQLPSTAGPRGLAVEKALGNLKRLGPGGEAILRFAFGFCDSLAEVPIKGTDARPLA